jgi:hypothetical protein
MAKFLIEVPHGADKAACDQAIQIFLQTGSHFLTHADWGGKNSVPYKLYGKGPYGTPGISPGLIFFSDDTVIKH